MSFDKRDYIVPDEIKINYKHNIDTVREESLDEESPNDDMRQVAQTVFKSLQFRREEMYVEIFDKPNYRSLVSYLQKLNPEFRRAY